MMAPFGFSPAPFPTHIHTHKSETQTKPKLCVRVCIFIARTYMCMSMVCLSSRFATKYKYNAHSEYLAIK